MWSNSVQIRRTKRVQNTIKSCFSRCNLLCMNKFTFWNNHLIAIFNRLFTKSNYADTFFQAATKSAHFLSHNIIAQVLSLFSKHRFKTNRKGDTTLEIRVLSLNWFNLWLFTRKWLNWKNKQLESLKSGNRCFFCLILSHGSFRQQIEQRTCNRDERENGKKIAT